MTHPFKALPHAYQPRFCADCGRREDLHEPSLAPAESYFDRFDICDAWHVWACEWGEYAVITRLDCMQYRPSPLLNGPDNLSDNAQALYASLTARSQADADWYAKRREAVSRASGGDFEASRA